MKSILIKSFYPCFNGIGVLTMVVAAVALTAVEVSILVLMESGFLPVVIFGIAIATIIAHVFNF